MLGVLILKEEPTIYLVIRSTEILNKLGAFAFGASTKKVSAPNSSFSLESATHQKFGLTLSFLYCLYTLKPRSLVVSLSYPVLIHLLGQRGLMVGLSALKVLVQIFDALEPRHITIDCVVGHQLWNKPLKIEQDVVKEEIS